MKSDKIVIAILSILIGILIPTVILLSWVPPVSRDALTHHLAVPKIYLQHGGMVELPDIPFSYFPMNLDLLYMVPLMLGNDILPKLIHFFFGLFTAGIIFKYVNHRFGAAYALFGVLFFLSLPVIIKLSTTVYVDLGLVFFSTAALLYLLKWGRDNTRYRYFIVSALFCGLALGTKYNGLVTLFILTLFVPFIYLRRGSRQPKRQFSAAGLSVVYLVIALTVFAPWMVRNAIWTGNPIYPLYNRFFSATAPPPAEEVPSEIQAAIKKHTQDWNHLAIRRIIYGESWGQIALIPMRIFFQGQDNTPQYFDGKLNPFLLFLTLLAFFPRSRLKRPYRLERNILAAFIILFLLISFFKTSIRIRYIAPVLPPLVILSCFGMNNVVSFFRKREHPTAVRAGLSTVLVASVVLLGMNTVYILDLFHKIDPFSYISGRLEREAYIAKYRPEYPVLKYANKTLTDNDRILGLYIGNRRYYCDRTLIFGEKKLTRAIIKASSADDVRATLRLSGYTHVLVHLNLLRQWAGSLNDRERRITADLFNNHMALIKQNQEYALFVLNHDAH